MSAFAMREHALDAEPDAPRVDLSTESRDLGPPEGASVPLSPPPATPPVIEPDVFGIDASDFDPPSDAPLEVPSGGGARMAGSVLPLPSRPLASFPSIAPVRADGGAGPDADTKYTYRRVMAKQDLPVPFGKGTFTIRWELSIKDAGKAKVGGASIGSAQQIFEREKEKVQAKVTMTLVKGTGTLLDGELPLGFTELGLSYNIEGKLLEAGLTTDEGGFDLKLANVALILEGDFAKWMSPAVREHVELEGQIRVDVQLGPEIVEDLVRAARAADDIKYAAGVEAKMAKHEKRLAELRRRPQLSAEELEKLHPKTANTHRALQAEARAVQKELDQLRGMRGKLNQLRAKGIQTLEKVGASLEKRAGGKLLKKIGGKALGMAFKKFIPIYNVISTAQDLVEAGRFLAGLDWSGMGEKIMEGGEGGDTIGDGSKKDPDEAGPGGEGEGGDTIGDADQIKKTLDARERVEQRSGVRDILDALGTSPQGKVMTDDETETLNSIVPADLTSEEIAAIKNRMKQSGAEPTSTTQAVIEALQFVRPFGEKQKQPASVTPAKESAPSRQTREPAAKREPKKPTGSGPEPKTRIVDPIPTLLATITFQDGRPIAPEKLAFDGVTVDVVNVKSSLYPTSGEEEYRYIFVMMRVLEAPPGRIARDGTVLDDEAVFSVVFLMQLPSQDADR